MLKIMTPQEIEQLKELLQKAVNTTKYLVYEIDYKIALSNLNIDSSLKQK